MSDENRSERAEQSTSNETQHTEQSREASDNVNANTETQNEQGSEGAATSEQQSENTNSGDTAKEASENINNNVEDSDKTQARTAEKVGDHNEPSDHNETSLAESGELQTDHVMDTDSWEKAADNINANAESALDSQDINCEVKADNASEPQIEDGNPHDLAESEDVAGKGESNDESEKEKTRGRELAILAELPGEQLTGLHDVTVVDDLGKATFTDSQGGEHEGEVAADYDREKGEIRITEDSIENDDAAQETLYHEVGHNVWFNDLTEDQRQEWTEFWEDNKNYMPTNYATSSDTEGFAECYSHYQSDSLRENPDHPEWSNADTWFSSHGIRRKGEKSY